MGFGATSSTPLSAGDVVAEAVDGEALAALLDTAGYRDGVRRSYAGAGLAIRRVEVRILRFSTEDGASRYLGWVQAHSDDLIGASEPAAAPELGRDVTVHVHYPDACCPREPTLSLAAWREGSDVIRVLVAGPGADGPRSFAVIEQVRRSLSIDA